MKVVLVLLGLAASLNAQGYVPSVYNKGVAAATWSLVHSTYCSSVTCSGGGTCANAALTCTPTIPSTTAGTLLVVWSGQVDSNASHTITSITDSPATGDTFTTGVTNCRTFNSSVGSIDCGYVLSGAGGKTSVQVTWSSNTGSGFLAVWVLEYSHTGTASFDVAGSINRTTCAASGTPCTWPSLTLTGTNDLIAGIGFPTGSLDGINDATYNQPNGFTDGFGIAAAKNKTSYTAPGWTDTSGNSTDVIVGAISFKQ